MDDEGKFEFSYKLDDILSAYFDQPNSDNAFFGRLNFNKVVAIDTSDNITETSGLDIIEPLHVNPSYEFSKPELTIGSNVAFTSPYTSSLIVSGNEIYDLINLNNDLLFSGGIFATPERNETLNIEDTVFGSSGDDYLNVGYLEKNKVFAGGGPILFGPIQVVIIPEIPAMMY